MVLYHSCKSGVSNYQLSLLYNEFIEQNMESFVGSIFLLFKDYYT